MGHKAQMNIKHVGSIASIHREIDEYMRDLQATSHHSHLPQVLPRTHQQPRCRRRMGGTRAGTPCQDASVPQGPRKTRKYDPQEKAKLLEMAYYFNAYGAPF